MFPRKGRCHVTETKNGDNINYKKEAKVPPTYHGLLSCDPVQGTRQLQYQFPFFAQCQPKLTQLDVYYILLRDLEAEVEGMDSFWEYSTYKVNDEQLSYIFNLELRKLNNRIYFLNIQNIDL